MTQYKLTNLAIKNFKCFEEITFNFEGNSLIVLDGPNGYGKTTAYEALEILLTKTPRKLTRAKLDKRYKYKNSPIHKQESKPIIISAIFFSDSNQPITIRREIPPASSTESKKNNVGQIFSDSVLFINDEKAEEQELEVVFDFKNIQNLFNVLNYIEQDENTYFLKEDPKERYKALISLLGGNEERVLYDKAFEFCKKITEKLNQINQEIDKIDKQNNEQLNRGASQPVYKKLLSTLAESPPWDNAQISNIALDVHNSYIFEIKKIENIFKNKNSIKAATAIRKIDQYLINNSFLSSFVENYWSIQNFPSLEAEDTNRKNNLALVSEYSSIIDLIDNAEYDKLLSHKHLFDLAEKEEKPNFNFETLRVQLTLITSLINSLNTQNHILSDLKTRSEGLNRLIEEHRSLIIIEDGQCPTCGFNWESSEQLEEKIAAMQEQLFVSYVSENARLEELKSELKSIFLDPLKDFAEAQISKLQKEIILLVNSDRFTLLKNSYDVLNARITDLFSLITIERQNMIEELLNVRELRDKENVLKQVIEILESAKPAIDKEIDIDELITGFSLYFSGNQEQLESLTDEDFTNKRLYIQFQYYNSLNQSFQNLVLRKENLEKLYSEVNGLTRKLDDKIRSYTKSIVEKITIPFYIFTGKILQNHTLGSGLLLILDINKDSSQIYIRPKHRDQEVTYTLSSGQLAATVISLMLVLNKVFNRSSLGTIFIDDPLQTLDEINSHSLVELLKYNFSGQQIILSTHEDRYSQFIQYKFSKFNLSNKSLRLKDLV